MRIRMVLEYDVDDADIGATLQSEMNAWLAGHVALPDFLHDDGKLVNPGDTLTFALVQTIEQVLQDITAGTSGLHIIAADHAGSEGDATPASPDSQEASEPLSQPDKDALFARLAPNHRSDV